MARNFIPSHALRSLIAEANKKRCLHAAIKRRESIDSRTRGNSGNGHADVERKWLRSAGPKSLKTLAGMPGFEPGNGGIKILCLTTWRHPNAETGR